MSAWPTKNTQKKTPALTRAREMMSEASEAVKKMHVSQIVAAQEISYNALGRGTPIQRNGILVNPEHRQKTQALWRDVLFMSLYCRLPIVIVTDEGEYRPVTSLYDLTRILDVFSQTPGAILVRQDDYWQGLNPNTPGLVLTLDDDGKPAWLAPSGGGGAWWFNPPSAADFTLASGDGNSLTITDDPDAGLLVNCGPPATGDVKRIAYQGIPVPAGNWTFTVRQQQMVAEGNYSGVGIFTQRSANSRILTAMSHNGNGYDFNAWPGLTGYFASYGHYSTQSVPHWLQIEKSGANLTARVSSNGKLWLQIGTTTTGAYLGGDPDRIGIIAFYNRSSGFQNRTAIENFTFTAS